VSDWNVEQNMRISVETQQAGWNDEQLRSLQLDGRQVEITETADQWAGAGHRYFKVRDAEGNLYIVRHDEPSDEWELTMFERPDVPLDAIGQEVRGRLQ